MSFTTVTLDLENAYRIIPSKYPPIDLFEDLTSDPEDWELLIELEMAVNPRLRDDVGEISLVPPESRITGPGASIVMAPFTHLNPLGSRFTDGSYGIYYAGDRFETALKETIHHLSRRLKAGTAAVDDLDQRVYVGEITGNFVDLTGDPTAAADLLDPDSYANSQPFAKTIRTEGSDGILYPSVRDPGQRAVAAFWPNVVAIPSQERHLRYHWDGSRISKYFDYERDEFVAVPG